MARIPSRPDFIDRLIVMDRRLHRLELRKPPRNTENFIMDPATPRAFPAALAPPRGVILQVGVTLGSGGPVTVTFYLVRADPPTDEPNPHALYTMTSVPGDGSVNWHELTDPVDIEYGDKYYPSIDSGGGNDITASFMLSN